mgnify:CR=1 FL=1
MSTPVGLPVTPPDPQGPAVVRPPAEDSQALQPPPIPAPMPLDTRLVIEEDKQTRTFIYKTLDRETGKVIQQFPREQVLRLRQDPDYTPGQVLKART